MLEIKKLDGFNQKNLNIVRKKTKKTQIFLFDTERKFNNYTSKLLYRNNGRYDEIPHFIITKFGEVYQIFDTKYSSRMFDDNKINNRQIKIAIENLGWLNKNLIGGYYCNWIGDTYVGEPFVKEWRGYYYWDQYTDLQLKSLYDLTSMLCEENHIPFMMVPSQGYFSNVINFSGIVCKSNFSDIYNNINPTFNFNFIKNYEYDE